MSTTLTRLPRHADDILRGHPIGLSFRASRLTIVVVLISAFLYGAAMGCSGEVLGERPLQILYSALKLPLLLVTSFALSLPSFFVLNTLLGVRDDFGRVLRALLSTQAALTVVLASLAPVTIVWYVSTSNHEANIV